MVNLFTRCCCFLMYDALPNNTYEMILQIKINCACFEHFPFHQFIIKYVLGNVMLASRSRIYGTN